jgi:hypothetical protein
MLQIQLHACLLLSSIHQLLHLVPHPMKSVATGPRPSLLPSLMGASSGLDGKGTPKKPNPWRIVSLCLPGYPGPLLLWLPCHGSGVPIYHIQNSIDHRYFLPLRSFSHLIPQGLCWVPHIEDRLTHPILLAPRRTRERTQPARYMMNAGQAAKPHKAGHAHWQRPALLVVTLLYGQRNIWRARHTLQPLYDGAGEMSS